jgi:hypothetical protein
MTRLNLRRTFVKKSETAPLLGRVGGNSGGAMKMAVVASSSLATLESMRSAVSTTLPSRNPS